MFVVYAHLVLQRGGKDTDCLPVQVIQDCGKQHGYNQGCLDPENNYFQVLFLTIKKK